MNRPVTQGTWLGWGIGAPADLSDGYMGTYISVYDEDLVSTIQGQDPEWPPPNDDVEDLNDAVAAVCCCRGMAHFPFDGRASPSKSDLYDGGRKRPARDFL